MKRVEVAIVGAGMHGTIVAVRLLRALPGLELCLVDPAGECLAEWRRQTEGQGMVQMRSTAAHHIDLGPESLLDLVRRTGRQGELLPPYSRPSLSLFMDHARGVIDRSGVEQKIVRARVTQVRASMRGWALELDTGEDIAASFVVVAPGVRGHERWPAWAEELRGHPALAHAADGPLSSASLRGRRVLVVGGGLSAATLADVGADRGALVTLMTRRPLEVRLFDADPGWVGPKYLSAFGAETDPRARLRMIERARGGGSITPEQEARLRAKARQQLIDIREGVKGTDLFPIDVRGEINLSPFDRVWLATGFSPSIERLDWLGELRGVPQVSGRPIIGSNLELAPGCFVSGWLADLELGPAARNIAGARAAAARIAIVVAQRRGWRAAA